MSNQGLSYVRLEMLDEKAPPSTQTGAIKWARENLFPNWINSILTLIAIYVIFVIVKALLPWAVFSSVWNAGSLTECREVLMAMGKTGHQGACWAVIEDRWHQLTFGFYPPDLYWRPILAFALFFVALAPVLFSERTPRQMIYFTMIYPFLATWLLWGGSFWGPLLVMAGFVAAYLAFRIGETFGGTILGFIAGVLAAVLWWLVASPVISDGLHRMVANSRIEAVAVELDTRLGELPDEIAVAEGIRDAKTAEINAVLADKNTIVAEIEAGHDDPEHPAPTTPELRGQLDDAMQTLAGLRDEHRDLTRVVLGLTEERSASRTLSNNITELPDRIARLPDVHQSVSDLGAALPSELRGLRTLQQAPSSTSGPDKDALDEYLTANSDLITLESQIDATYSELGRVGLEPVQSKEIGGFLLAIVIGISGIVLSMPLGIILALGRQSDLLIVNKSCVFFIEIIRGIPLIVWLFTASLLLNYFLPPGTNFDLMLRVIIMVTLFSAAYIAEVIRGGLAALPRGQFEAADALGLDYWKAMRLIVLPQALKISIPGIVSSFIGLFKDTTLVVFIGLADPIDFSNKIRADTAWNGIYWELFAFIGLCFWISCFCMSQYSQWLERKLHTGHR